MIFIKEHRTEILLSLLSLVIAFEVYQTRQLNALAVNDAVQKEQIASIAKQVNHVKEGEDTLREIVLDNQRVLDRLIGKLDSRINDEDVAFDFNF